MARTHRHRTPDFWTSQRVPTGPVEIDWTHPLAQGLIGLWPFSTDALDHSQRDNNTALAGSPAWANSGTGRCLSLVSASSQYVNLGAGVDVLSIAGVSFAMFGSVMIRATGEHGDLFGYANGGFYYPFIALNGAGQFVAQLYNGSFITLASEAEAQAGVWYRYAIEFSSVTQTFSLYVNGELEASASTATYTSNAGGTCYLGAGVGGTGDQGGLNGNISISGIYYSQVPSAIEIAWLSAEPFAMLRPKFVPRRRGPLTTPATMQQPLVFAIT